MYIVLRILQIVALVVFLWGKSNNNAEHLMGAGGPFLVWGKFCGDDHRVLSVKKRISEKS